MSRNNSTCSFQGFSISQPALGAALQFYPALGTAELDILIDAYVPGLASVKDKRAQVTMEFFTHAEQTGEFIKFFPVFTFDPLVADSPASSSFYDSGYGSAFTASPVVPDMTWAQPAQFIPSHTSASSSQSRRRSGERKTSSVAQGTTHDFSHIPGMKILTKEGVDVTNAASRGCKTKEQRDHAHLMRIIKACDSCKKKKIRCDPSHKKRPASQSSSPEAKPAKKTKKTAPPPMPPTPPTPQQISPADSSDFFAGVSPLDLDTTAAFAPTTEFVGDVEQDWQQFLHYADAPVAVPNYDFGLDPASYLSSPSSGPSDFSPQPFTPVDVSNNAHLRDLEFQQPTLPYLNTGAHGSNYVDFGLYESQQSFSVLDPTDVGWSPPGGEDLGSGAWCQHSPGSPPGASRPILPLSAASPRELQRGEGHSQPSPTGLSTRLRQSTALSDPRTSATAPAGHIARDPAIVNSQSSDGSTRSSPASSSDCCNRQSTVSASASPCSAHDPGKSSHAPSATTQSASGLQTPDANLCGDGRDRLSAAAYHTQRAHAIGDGRDRLDRDVSTKASLRLTTSKSTTELAKKQHSASAVAASSQPEHFSVVSILAPARSKSSSTEQPSTTTALINRQPSSIGSRQETQEYWATSAPFTATADQQLQRTTAAGCSPGLAVDTQAGYSRTENTNDVAGLFLATILLLTLPFRHYVEGTQTKPSSSLFVGLGLVSIISSVILHASSSDTLQKLAILPLSLVLVLQHLTSRPFASVRKAPFGDAIDNVKSRIQDVSRMFAMV